MANIDRSIIKVMKEIYDDSVCQVKVGSSLSQVFHTS